MIGKRLMLLLFVFVNVQISHATEWYDYQYEFPYFRYNAKATYGKRRSGSGYYQKTILCGDL